MCWVIDRAVTHAFQVSLTRVCQDPKTPDVLNTAFNPYTRKVFTLEMRRQRTKQARPRDNVGLNTSRRVAFPMPNHHFCHVPDGQDNCQEV